MAGPRPTAVAAPPILDGVLQLLTSSGERLRVPEFDDQVADLGPVHLRRLFEDMSIIRRLDTEATALQRQGQLGLWPPLLGQEAAQVASARSLRPDDFVFTSYREHGVAYCRGARPVDLVRAWRGTAVSGWNPYELNLASAQVIIGAHALHATGYAMGIQRDGADSVAVAYFGDGAMSEGDVAEAMVFAASFRAPVIFFVQNNQWAISEPVAVQAAVSLADRGPGFGIPSLRIDGNDVLAVTAATRIALDRARRGDGPTLIEAVTYRMGPHTTADDPTRYRPAGELDVWAALDPIARLEAYLLAEDELSDEFRSRVAAQADAAAAELRSECVALADPAPLSIFDHVYTAPHARLDEQRAAYADYLQSFEGSPS
ncbi:MAG: pyruvate dehydrogenase (acetyl-transferring) E1 component subunit alpha [Actinomycetota bacterium]|nr:pyruvate dehydrogenase (acetyl-transferring) E1 component subunit alpha [Actinomycetota bacterium]